MKDRINTYFAILLITLAGAGATMLIVHVALANAYSSTFTDSEAVYASLQQSVVNQ